MPEKCPVCKTDIQKPTPFYFDGGGKLESFSCPRCGDFVLGWNVLRPDVLRDAILKGDVVNIAKLSHSIRTRHESLRKEPPDNQGWRKANLIDEQFVKSALDEKWAEATIKNPRPTLLQQADNFIRWIGDSVKVAGEYVDVNQLAIQALVGSATFEEFELVFRYVRDKGLIEHKTGSENIWVKARLSFAGWERYQEIKRSTSDSRKVLMAMQYNRKPLEDIVEGVFRHAVRQTGFDLFLLRDRPIAGLIDNRLRTEIRASRFLIADLTHGNPGAYWEAGYAEGLGKPVIYTCEKRVFGDSKRKPHFNTSHHQTVLWDSKRPEDIAKELKATIRATLPAEAKMNDD